MGRSAGTGRSPARARSSSSRSRAIRRAYSVSSIEDCSARPKVTSPTKARVGRRTRPNPKKAAPKLLAVATRPRATRPPDTAARNMFARPVDSAIVAARAPWSTKCSVVTNVTAAERGSPSSVVRASLSIAASPPPQRPRRRLLRPLADASRLFLDLLLGHGRSEMRPGRAAHLGGRRASPAGAGPGLPPAGGREDTAGGVA